jgi:hypothetical protein
MQPDQTSYSPYGIDLPGHEHRRGPLRSLSDGFAPRRRKGLTLQPGGFCLAVAGLAALTGMTLGMAMGISQDFTLAPAHAHLNLLGWVTMALYGLYHRSSGRTGGWLVWLQVLSGAIGAATMSGGLALYLNSGDHRFMPLVVAGSLLAFFGMVLFVVILLIDLLRTVSPQPGADAL